VALGELLEDFRAIVLAEAEVEKDQAGLFARQLVKKLFLIHNPRHPAAPAPQLVLHQAQHGRVVVGHEDQQMGWACHPMFSVVEGLSNAVRAENVSPGGMIVRSCATASKWISSPLSIIRRAPLDRAARA
jgi:hypothetical protein